MRHRKHVQPLQADDKQNCSLGEPGTAVSLLSKQKKSLAKMAATPEESRMRAMDHDAGMAKTRFVPTVALFQDVPETADGTWNRGQLYVTLKDLTMQPSEANRALHEIEWLLQADTRAEGKSMIWLHADEVNPLLPPPC